MGAFRYLRPDKMVTLDAVVTGSVDSGYQASWLCDGRPGFPVLGPGSGSPSLGDLSLSIAPLVPGACDFVAATHLRLDDAVDIVLGGDLSVTLEGRGDQGDGIPLNRWAMFTSVPSVDSITFVISGNSTPPVVGEFFTGASNTLPRRLRMGAQRGFSSFAIPSGAEFASVLAYDKGLSGALLQGTQTFKEAELDAIVQWFKSCRDGSLPTVIVPDDSKNECLVVQFAAPLQITEGGRDLLDVTFTFQEIPRQRW